MDWTHPAIENPDAAIHDRADIAAEALAAFNRRRAAYPDHVKAGAISEDDARADLAAWREIARDWRWIALGDGQPATGETLAGRIAALDTAIERFLEQAAEHGGRLTDDEARQGALLCAMRWWAQRERAGHCITSHTRFYANIGHSWRAENGHPTLGEKQRSRQSQAPSNTQRIAA